MLSASSSVGEMAQFWLLFFLTLPSRWAEGIRWLRVDGCQGCVQISASNMLHQPEVPSRW